MGKKTSSKLSQVLFIVVLLCISIYRTESAIIPSHHEQLLITGRKMMAYNPYGGLYVEPLPSKSKYNHQKGERLETSYKPNSDIFTGPSHSGHGGSSIDQVSSP